MWYNPIITFLLRSPLQAMLGDTMLVTVRGKKTGKQYTTPVGFYRDNDQFWILTNRDRTWWRNVCGGAIVTMRLHGKEVCGFAETIIDENEVAVQMQEYLRRIPMAARGLGARIENGSVNAADALILAKEKLFVKISVAEDGNHN